MEKTVKVSVVMPVLNGERFLKAAVNSVLNQSLAEIELICVDDGSADNSLYHLRNLQRKDSRIRIIAFEENKGTLAARLAGVAAATGKYLMFLDCDDELLPQACETVRNRMESSHADILQFHTQCTVDCAEPLFEAEDLQEKLNRRFEVFPQWDSFAEHFLSDTTDIPTVWNKAYRTELCQGVIGKLSMSEKVVAAADFLFLFLVGQGARSAEYCDQSLYRHYIGRGLTGHNEIGFEQFNRLCTMKTAYSAAAKLAKENGLSATVLQALDNRFRADLSRLVDNWVKNVSKKDGVRTWEELVTVFDADTVLDILYSLYAKQHESVKQRLSLPLHQTEKEKPVRHIGVCYYRLSNGGIERVTSTIIPKWLEKGYRVTLITEKQPSSEDYPIPEGVNRIYLPEEADALENGYAARAAAWKKLIRDNQIDTVVHEEYFGPLLFWDALMLKAIGCNLIIWSHNLHSMAYRLLQVYSVSTVDAYQLADRVIVLSPVFKQFWGSFSPAPCIPNPVYTVPEYPDWERKKNNILWVGRFSHEKRPYDVLKVFAKIVEKIPDATLTVVGKGETAEVDRKMYDMAARLKIADKVDFVGFHKDVTPFYKAASAFLMTSAFEGFGLVLGESKCCGLPILMYDLPYLVPVIDRRGVITTPQEDIDSLAQATVELLLDDAKRERIGLEGYQAAVDAASFDYAAAWDRVFESFGKSVPEEWLVSEEQKIMLRQLTEDFSTGLGSTKKWMEDYLEKHSALWSKMGYYQVQCNQFDQTLKEIYNSKAYKIGKFITAVPRLLKTTLKKRSAKVEN